MAALRSASISATALAAGADTLFNTSFNTSQYGNQFTTVTGTYSPENGGTLTVYFNGEPICTLPNVGSVKPSDFDLWIGKDPENPGRTGSGDYSSAASSATH